MNASRWWTVAIFVVLILPLPGRGLEPPKQPRPDKERVDLHGDPLPKGAVARLGTIRFRHDGAVWEVAFSHDGKLLAASSDDHNKLILWDRASGRKIHELHAGGNRGFPPSILRFSHDDTRLLAIAGDIGGVSLHTWDTKTGADARGLSPVPMKGHKIGLSSGGRELLLLEDSEIVRWDVEKGKEVGRYPMPKDALYSAIHVGERILIPQFDKQGVGVFDLAAKKQLWSMEATPASENSSVAVAFSGDGRLFAAATSARVVSVRESATGKAVQRLQADGAANFFSLAFSSDARTLAGSNWDGSLRLWDLDSGRERAKITRIQGHVTYVYFAPDSKVFATGGGNNAHGVVLWETATGKPVDHCPGHTSPLSSVAFSPDGRMAATSSWLRGDPVIRLWDPQSGRLLNTFEMPAAAGVSAVAFSPDGRTLAACNSSGGNQVRIWDLGTGRVRHDLIGHEAGCTCLAFSPDGKRLASGDAYSNGPYQGRLCIWDAESGKRLHEIRGTRGAIQRVRFTPDGRQVLAAADGVHIYAVDSGQLVGEPLQPKSRVWGLALSPDGRLLATADGRTSVRLWELATRREILPAVSSAAGYDVEFAADGRTLIASEPQGVIFLFLPSGRTVGKLSGDAGTVTRAFLSPDGRQLATASNAESSSLIWDVSDLVKEPLPRVAKPDEEELRKWWTDLRNDNPAVAYDAIWRLAAAREQAAPFLVGVLPPVKAAEPAAVARLIADLDSKVFAVRERAFEELSRLGETAIGALQNPKKEKISLEHARRIDRLLDDYAALQVGPEHWRLTRAMTALEQMGGPEARQVIARLAGGAAGARLTEEARAALERLKRIER